MSWPERPSARGGKLRTALDTELLLDQVEDLSADEADWTPTLTNLTVASGTLTSKYWRVPSGGHGRFMLKFTYGAGSAVGNPPTFTLPFTLPSHYVEAYVGDVRLLNVGVAAVRGAIRCVTTTSCDIIYHPAGGNEANVSSTAPFTWGSGDMIVAVSSILGLA